MISKLNMFGKWTFLISFTVVKIQFRLLTFPFLLSRFFILLYLNVMYHSVIEKQLTLCYIFYFLISSLRHPLYMKVFILFFKSKGTFLLSSNSVYLAKLCMCFLEALILYIPENYFLVRCWVNFSSIFLLVSFGTYVRCLRSIQTLSYHNQ